MKNKPTAVVLGGTRPHILLIEKLKERGFYIILIDFLDNPIAKSHADIHIKESTLEKEVVLRIAKEYEADLVISTCVDQANVTACYVAEKMGLPSPYNYETAIKVTNKVLMKQIMMENDIPTSKYLKIQSIKEYDLHELKYPVIVKPTDSNSSKGVRKISTENENIEEAIQIASKISRNKEVIVEEFITGIEIGIDCFVKNGTAIVLMVKERRKINKNHKSVQQIYGCIWPIKISKEIFDQIKKISNQIANAFHLNNTPLMIQAILNENTISVIEFGARIGGGESYKIIKESTGFDYLDASIESFLGHEVTMNNHEPNMFYADNFIYARQGVFDHIAYDKFLLSDNILEYCNSLKEKGTEIDEDISSNNRVGVFTVKSNTVDELYNKINLVLKSIDVYDIDGNSIMRKDIY